MAKDLSSLESKILLTGSLTTARRFVQKLNIFGVRFVNYKTHTLSSLLHDLLIKQDPTIRLVSNDESAYIIWKLIEKNNYGLNGVVKSLGASLKLLEVLNDYRLNNDESFSSLINADYKSLLKDYKDYLNTNSLIDYPYALEAIKGQNIEETIYIMSDISLRPFEEKILNGISDNRLVVLEDQKHDIDVKEVFECYGQYGELLNVLNYIEENQIPLGDVEVIYTDTIFENLIKGTCDARRIPYTLKTSHAKSTNLVSFLIDVLSFYAEDFKYELLEEVLSNQGLNTQYLQQFYKTLAFPKYIVGFSQVRSYEFLNAYQNDESIKDFYLLFKDIIDVVSDNKIDYEKLLDVAMTYLSSEKEKEVLGSSLDSIKYIVSHESDLQKQIDLIQRELASLTYSEKETKDHIAFSSISRSITSRKHVFVIGLNQNLMLGNDVENAFIEDLESFKNDLSNDKNIHLNEYQKKKAVENLLYCLSHCDSIICLSYSSDNKIDLRDMTEGIYLLNISNLPDTKKINAYNIRKDNYHFGKTDLKEVDKVEPDYDNGQFHEIEGSIVKDVVEAENPQEIVEIEENKEFTLSPSAMKDLMECPLRFYYGKIMGIDSIQYPALDESEWLESNKKGTFFHRVMQLYFNNFINKDPNFVEKAFLRVFEYAKKEAIETNPISNEYITEKEIENIKKVSEMYLKNIISQGTFALYKPLYNEKRLKDLNYRYPKCKSLLFSGDVDRVDGYVKDNTLHLRLVDYKTGRYKGKGEHGYLQHILYSYVLENSLREDDLGLKFQKVEVDRFVYSYPFDDLGRENVYERNEFNSESVEYQEVMEKIDLFIVPYLDKEKEYIQNVVAYFDSHYEKAKKDDQHIICMYCRYIKECIKTIMGGFNGWKKMK